MQYKTANKVPRQGRTNARRLAWRYDTFQMNKLIILTLLVLSGCASQKYPWAKSQGPCSLTEQQKSIAWNNVVEAMKSEHPKHSEYCQLEAPASHIRFSVVEGKCRTYLGCGKHLESGYLLHGDVFVYVNEATLEVTGIRDVAW